MRRQPLNRSRRLFDARRGPDSEVDLARYARRPDLDYLKAPRFAAGLHAWAVAEARTRLLSDYIGRLAEGASDSGIGDLAEGAACRVGVAASV